MNELEEGAKAVQETAKLGQELAKRLPEVSAIGKAILGPVGEGWIALTSWARYGRSYFEWRLENKEKIYRQVEQKMADQHIRLEHVTPVPQRVAHVYEEGLEHEDDPTLQELWANLLVNVTRPDDPVTPLRAFKDVLSRMEPDDAEMLKFLVPLVYVEFALRELPLKDKGRRVCLDLHPSERRSHIGFAVASNVNGSDLAEIASEEIMVPLGPGTHRLETQVICFHWAAERVTSCVDRLVQLGLVARKQIVPNLHNEYAWPVTGRDQAVSLEVFRHLLRKLQTREHFVFTEFGRQFFAAVQDPSASASSR